MKLNPHKTHSITLSRSRKPYPPHPPLTFYRLDWKFLAYLKLLGVTIDKKLTFKKHIASSIAQKFGLIQKCYKTLGNNDAVLKSFYTFILPFFKYCSASDLNLKLLHPVINNF